jgi:hypothetical protein
MDMVSFFPLQLYVPPLEASNNIIKINGFVKGCISLPIGKLENFGYMKSEGSKQTTGDMLYPAVFNFSDLV